MDGRSVWRKVITGKRGTRVCVSEKMENKVAACVWVNIRVFVEGECVTT